MSSVSCLSILCFLLHTHTWTHARIQNTRQEVSSCQGDNMGTTASSWEPARHSGSGSSSSSCEGGGRLEPKASLPPTMRKSPQIRQLPALSPPPQVSAGGWEDGWEVRSRRPGNWLRLSTSSRRGTRRTHPPEDLSIWSSLQRLCLCISVRPAVLPLVCVWVVGRRECPSLRVVLNLSCTAESSGEL